MVPLSSSIYYTLGSIFSNPFRQSLESQALKIGRIIVGKQE